MRTDGELSQWLEEEARQGNYDSTGVFTIEQSKAWRKLAAHAMPYHHAWVSKLVQSAVLAASELAVAQTRTESRFVWDSVDWTPDRVRDAMLSIDERDPALRHLGHGLRWLAKGTSLGFAIRLADGRSLVWNGKALLDGPSLKKGTHRFSVIASHFEPGQPTGFLSPFKRQAAHHRATIGKVLSSRGRWAPTPVRLDGRMVSNIFNEPEFSGSHLRQPIFLVQAAASESIPSLKVQADPGRVVTRKFLSSEIPRLGAEPAQWRQRLEALENPCLAVGMVSVALESGRKDKRDVPVLVSRKSLMVWVTDGVEVLRQELPFQESCTPILVVCSAAGLTTDASGLNPVESEEKAGRAIMVLDALADVFPNLDDDDPEYRLRSNLNLEAKGMLLVGTVGLLMGQFMGLVLLGFGAFSWRLEAERVAVLKPDIDASLQRLLLDMLTRTAAE